MVQGVAEPVIRYNARLTLEIAMAERSRTRRNTLERRCLPKTFKRLFVGSSRTMFRLLEKVKKA